MVTLLTFVKEKVLVECFVIILESGFRSKIIAVSGVDRSDSPDCPAEDGWALTLENTIQERSCGAESAGTFESRSCGFGGVWGETDFSQCKCPAIGDFPATPYNSTNRDNRCDNGVVVSRLCKEDGSWSSVTYEGLCRRNELRR